MADLELGLSVEGVDEAVRDLGRVGQAQSRVADAAAEQARAASGQARQIASAQRQIVDSTTASSRSAVDSARSFGQMATSLGNVGSVVGRVSPQLGAIGSVIGQVGGATTALSGAMGPLGVATAALTAGLGVLAIAQRESAERFREMQRAARGLLPTLGDVLTRMRQAQQLQRQSTLLRGGFGGIDEQEAASQAARQRAATLEAAAQSAEDFLGGTQRGPTTLLEGLSFGLLGGTGGVSPEIIAAREARGVEGDALQAEVTQAELRQIQSELAQARNEAEGFRRGLAQARIDVEDLSTDDAGNVLDSLVEDARGGGGSRERTDPMVERLRAFFEQNIPRGPGPSLGDDAFGMVAAGGEGDLSDLAGEFDVSHIEEMDAKTREAAEAQRELALAAAEAQAAFGEGYTTSIDDIVESWRDANDAIRRAGGTINSTARLMERSLVAVGNNIAETIGGTMQGAFSDALGAWLDGSKSFVQAAEDMAKGVIKALTIESIVQAVTEVARAVASFASQDYASGVAHLAAAAAWGAVGVVAGGVGAAVGAFGGGGGADKSAGGGADNRDLSSRSVSERDVSQPIVVNVYPEVFANRNAQRFVYDAMNAGARDGRTIDSRALRGVGR